MGNIGVMELILTGVLVLAALGAGWKWPATRRWAAAIPLATLAAAALTPADLVSTLPVTGACLLFFAAGEISRRRPRAAMDG